MSGGRLRGFKLFFAWWRKCLVLYSIRYFNAPSEGSTRFKAYTTVAFVSTLLLVCCTIAEAILTAELLMFTRSVYLLMFYGFMIATILDVIFLFSTAGKIFRIATVSNAVDHERFEAEKKR